MEEKILQKRFEDISSRLETLEINCKEDELKTVVMWLNADPDELDKIFQFKLNLKQIRELIHIYKGKVKLSIPSEKVVKRGK